MHHFYSLAPLFSYYYILPFQQIRHNAPPLRAAHRRAPQAQHFWRRRLTLAGEGRRRQQLQVPALLHAVVVGAAQGRTKDKVLFELRIIIVRMC